MRRNEAPFSCKPSQTGLLCSGFFKAVRVRFRDVLFPTLGAGPVPVLGTFVADACGVRIRRVVLFGT